MKKKLYYQFAASCCLLLFIFLGYVVKFYPDQLVSLDNFFSDLIRQGYSPLKTLLLKIITQLGSGKGVGSLCILLCALLIWNKKYITAAWLFINTAIIAGIGNYTIKFIFMRERPSVEHLVKETHYSFPSGHSMGSMLFYGTCIILAYYFIQKRPWRILIQLLLALLILTIGWSRVYLGVHYPTDIIGGYLLGLAWIWFSYPIYLKQRLVYTYKRQQHIQTRTKRRR